MVRLFRIFKEHRHFGKQIFLLSKNELIKTYKGAFLGFAWAVIKPAFTLFALWFLFALGLRNGGELRHGAFGVFSFLLVGYIPWFFMNDSILFGTKCIRANSQFVTKISYPVSTIMTFTNLSKFYIQLILTVLMYVVLMLTGDVGPMIQNIQFLFYAPLMFFFFLGLSWFNAPLAVFSRDFENLVNSILTMLFWVSGTLFDTYALENPILRIVMYFNPITYFINGYRKTFLYGEWFWQQSTSLADGHNITSALWENVIFFAELIAIILLGAWNYNRTRKKIADIL